MPTFYGNADQDANDFTAAFLLTMNSSISKVLNELCSSSLIDSDQAAFEAFIKDYFFDETHEEKDPDPPSKIIIILIMQTSNNKELYYNENI